MFKYTPPWQVLCNSLGRDLKRQASTMLVNPYEASTHSSVEEQAVNHSHSSLRPPLPRLAQNHPPPRDPMTSNPKLWVIKPLSPKLEQSDLRSILSPTGQPQLLENTCSSSQDSDSFGFSLESITVTGMQPTVMVSSRSSTPGVVVQARQVAVSDDGSDSEDFRPSTPSSTGSYVGFYSFVDDPASPEAEMNEVYMVSPQRQAKLNTLKEKSTFKLQTYTEEKRPGRLFEETNGDDCYQIEDTSTVNEDKENPDRMEIIRNQAPKKSPALKSQWSTLENLDLSSTPQRLMDGFSLNYKPVSVKTEQTRVESSTIDSEQIDFNAARKQFLMMERSKQNPFLQSTERPPYSPKLRGRSLSSIASIFNPKQVSKENSIDENQIALVTQQQEIEVKTVTVTEDSNNKVPSGAFEDIDSGLGERSGGYASDGSISNDPSITEKGSSLTMISAEETPIQREIRIAQQREESLRRLRGILHKDNSEMVEIRIKPILSLSSSQVKAPKTREQNRVSFLIQREREKLRQITNSVSSHDTQENQVQENKKSVESKPDEIPVTSLRASISKSPTTDLEQSTVSADDMWISKQPALVEEGDVLDSKEDLSPCCPHRHPDESILQRNPDSSTFRNQLGAYPEDNNHSKVRVHKENGVECQIPNLRTKKGPSWFMENDNSMSGKNRFHFPNTPSPLEPAKSSRYTPTWQTHLDYTDWSPKIQNAPNNIRQEIEEDLRREQELQELRESSSQSFSVPNSALVNPALTSSEPMTPLASEETVFSPQNPHGNMAELDSVFPEKKTDYSNPYSWSRDTSQLSTTDKGPQLSSTRPSFRLPSMSIMTPQPWGSPKPMSPTVSRAPPVKPLSALAELSSPSSQKGLTETLLKDFEDRRIKLKLEESAYAGIQPIDAINNEVVEATRVTRHKNQRALQWEAGMYANQES
ncbi:mitotic interactor and substrate of PLK1 isoform X1 [Carassius auratus]|uniref:Mitotic interactor and substrate of PLK1-like isoform X1 n=2 Tax=Carassius auratus TaxID=7957 RepID=A0A6P6KWX4_CARAU|nr:mitotic interactor and substrate of PLK1-like isoform X1 [Carassius auratus]XP_026076808.1 mitotic interactor and substrate of PLK1-like isoform X1 [Carassius auratus]